MTQTVNERVLKTVEGIGHRKNSSIFHLFLVDGRESNKSKFYALCPMPDARCPMPLNFNTFSGLITNPFTL